MEPFEELIIYDIDKDLMTEVEKEMLLDELHDEGGDEEWD